MEKMSCSKCQSSELRLTIPSDIVYKQTDEGKLKPVENDLKNILLPENQQWQQGIHVSCVECDYSWKIDNDTKNDDFAF